MRRLAQLSCHPERYSSPLLMLRLSGPSIRFVCENDLHSVYTACFEAPESGSPMIRVDVCRLRASVHLRVTHLI